MSDPSATPAPARKRGAQPGNDNALKHGFYSRTWKQRDRKGFEEMKTISLVDEINLLRVSICRLVESSHENDTPTASVQFVRTLSLALIALNRLIRTQNDIHSPDDEFQESFMQALRESNREMGIDERFKDLR
jgi:uncharacterized protein YjcR